MSAQRIRSRLRREFLDKEARRDFARDHLDASIALQLKTLRLQNGWTQEQLAEEAGMKQSRISAMEQTDHSGWSIRTLQRLAEAFDQPLRVKIGSWGDLIEDACHLGRSDLEKPRVEDDPGVHEPVDYPSPTHSPY